MSLINYTVTSTLDLNHFKWIYRPVEEHLTNVYRIVFILSSPTPPQTCVTTTHISLAVDILYMQSNTPFLTHRLLTAEELSSIEKRYFMYLPYLMHDGFECAQ